MAVIQGGREASPHTRCWPDILATPSLQCQLETGPTHQIRVHLSWQNHPILGDLVYGHKSRSWDRVASASMPKPCAVYIRALDRL